MTDDLIARLSNDLKPVPRTAMRRLLAGALALGAMGAFVMMMPWLGLRADIASVGNDMIFWTKFGYTAAFAAFGGAATLVLARPGGRTIWPWVAALVLAGVLGLAAAVQMMGAPAEEKRALIMGSTALVCPWYIVALSLPVLAAVLATMRRFAPTRPTLAGFAAGLLSGGVGAAVYSLHCGENGLMFLLAWYTLGIAVVSLIGAMLGRYLLRW
jgi:hypothetical protein